MEYFVHSAEKIELYDEKKNNWKYIRNSARIYFL